MDRQDMHSPHEEYSKNPDLHHSKEASPESRKVDSRSAPHPHTSQISHGKRKNSNASTTQQFTGRSRPVKATPLRRQQAVPVENSSVGSSDVSPTLHGRRYTVPVPHSAGSHKRSDFRRASHAGHSKTRRSVMVARDRGYTISRSTSTVSMTINTATFFDGILPEKKENPKVQSPRPNSASMKQIQELTNQLEQLNLANIELQGEMAVQQRDQETEREEHKAEIEKIHEQYAEEKKEARINHLAEMSMQAKKHTEELSKLKASHNKEMLNVELKWKEKEAILQEEMLMQRVKHTEAVTEIRQQNVKMIQSVKERLRKEHKQELDNMEKLMRQDSTEQMKQLRQDLTKEHQEEIQELVKKHEQEMGVLSVELKKIQELEDQLAKSKKHSKKIEKQCSRLKVELKEAHTLQLNTEAKLLEIRTELQDLQNDYQNKIREAQAQTKQRLDELLLENCQLRKKLLRRTEEFSTYRSRIESNSAKTIRSYREKVHVMVRARTKANLGVAMGLSETEADFPAASRLLRPSSAPTTQGESRQARRQVLAHEPPNEKHPLEQVKQRPKSCLGHFMYTL